MPKRSKLYFPSRVGSSGRVPLSWDRQEAGPGGQDSWDRQDGPEDFGGETDILLSGDYTTIFQDSLLVTDIFHIINLSR